MAKELKLYSFVNFNHLFGALGAMNGLDLDPALLDECLVDADARLQSRGPVIFQGVKCRLVRYELQMVQKGRIAAKPMQAEELARLVSDCEFAPDPLELLTDPLVEEDCHCGHRLVAEHFGPLFEDCPGCRELMQREPAAELTASPRIAKRDIMVRRYRNAASAFV